MLVKDPKILLKKNKAENENIAVNAIKIFLKMRLVEYRRNSIEREKITARSVNKVSVSSYKSRWKCSNPSAT